MNRSLPTILTIILSLAGYTSLAVAQVSNGNIETPEISPGEPTQLTPSSSNPSSEALSLLLEQIQQLRTEMQAMRAMVEEQGFELRRLQRDSLSRYTNTDERLGALESAIGNPEAVSLGAGSGTPRTGTPLVPGSPTPAVSPDRRVPSNASSAAIDDAPSNVSRGNDRNRSALQPVVLSEQQLYQMAYESVINNNLVRSIAEFDQYLSVYPEGRFVTNAHYWKGQALYYLNRFAEARQAYEIILDQYPDSPKLPEAMFGLGQAFHGMGDIPEARQVLNELKRRFPNTSAAELADSRLLQLN